MHGIIAILTVCSQSMRAEVEFVGDAGDASNLAMMWRLNEGARTRLGIVTSSAWRRTRSQAFHSIGRQDSWMLLHRQDPFLRLMKTRAAQSWHLQHHAPAAHGDPGLRFRRSNLSRGLSGTGARSIARLARPCVWSILLVQGGGEKKIAPTATKKERGEEAPMPRTVRGLPQTSSPASSAEKREGGVVVFIAERGKKALLDVGL